jgi:hypothetical protein
VGGTPHNGDPPAQELEFSNDFLRPSRVLMIMLIEVKRINRSLVVDTDEYHRAW